MAGIRSLIHKYAYGGPVRRYAAGDVVDSTSIVQDPQFGTSTTAAPTPQPAFSSDPTINAAWLALTGKSGDVNATGLTAQQKADAQAVLDARTKIAQQNAAYNENKNVQGLYNLNQGNANTFLKDANAVTNTAGNTMTNFEKILAASPTNANALFEVFNGTGSNPLLGQYNVLPAPTGTQGGILPWQNGAPGVGTAGTPAYVPPAPVGNTSASVVNTGTTSGTGTGTTSGTTTGTTSGTTGAATTNNGVYSLLQGEILPIGAKFDSTKVPVNGTSYTDESGFIHIQTTSGEYVVNPKTQVIVSYAPNHTGPAANTYVKPTGSNYVPPAPTITPAPTIKTYDWTDQDVANAKNPYGEQLPIGSWFDSKTTPITGTPTVLETGVTIIPTKNGSYVVNSKTGEIVNYTNTVKPNQAYFDSVKGAKGGSVKMPQEYSKGNWKLI